MLLVSLLSVLAAAGDVLDQDDQGRDSDPKATAIPMSVHWKLVAGCAAGAAAIMAAIGAVAISVMNKWAYNEQFEKVETAIATTGAAPEPVLEGPVVLLDDQVNNEGLATL